MSAFEKAEYGEIRQAMARAAGYELELVEVPDISTPPVKQYDLAPNVRHINRNKRTCWLGPGIEKPQ